MSRKKNPMACGCWFDARTSKRIRCEDHPLKPKEPPRKIYYVMSPKAILEFGRGIQDPMARALFFFLYLAGPRISEATDFSLMRLQESEDRRTIRLRTLKQRGGSRPLRDVPIPKGALTKCYEDEMWEQMMDYLRKAPNGGERIFQRWNCKSGVRMFLARNIEICLEVDIRQKSGEYVTKSVTKPFHPHFLRHCRATHLVEYYDFSDNQLCKFFGWTNPQMAQRYTQKADVWRAFLKHKA